MTPSQSLIARTSLGTVAAIVCFLVSSSARILTLTKRRFDSLVIGGMVVTRLLLYSLIFLVLRIPVRGDIPGCYVPEGLSALHGLLVYRDYISSYAPLHSYLDAIFLYLWRSPLSVILFAVAAEWLIIPLWLKVSRDILPERIVRIAAVLYLFSPLSIQYVTVDGQDNVIIAVLLVLAVMLLFRSRVALSALCVSASIATFKFLPLIYLPSFFGAAGKKRWLWLGVFAIPTFLLYGAFYVADSPVLVPLQREGGLQKASDLPFVIDAIVGKMLPAHLWDGIVVLALAAMVALILKTMHSMDLKSRIRILTFSMPALMLIVLLLSKKSWPTYFMMVLFPLCLLVANLSVVKRAIFLLFNIVAVTEHSFWTIKLKELDAVGVHSLVALHNSTALLFMALEVALLAGYVWLLTIFTRAIIASEIQ
jgi:hypothetical protein